MSSVFGKPKVNLTCTPPRRVSWLEQVGDGLAKEVAIELGAEICEVADGHQDAQQRPEGTPQPYPVASRDRRVTEDTAELLFNLLVVTFVSLDVQAGQGRLVALVEDEQLTIGQHRV